MKFGETKVCSNTMDAVKHVSMNNSENIDSESGWKKDLSFTNPVNSQR